MRTVKHTLFCLGFSIVLVSACKDEVVKAPPSLFGFESNEPYVFTESDPDFYIPVSLDKAQFAYTAADLGIEHLTSGTAEWTDYSVDKRIMIYGGEAMDYIGMKIYNDMEADGNDTLDVTLTNLDGNAYLDEDMNKRKARVIILDDDNYPSTQLRIHAFWTGESQISRDFKKDFDLDLYLLKDVVIGEDGIESGDYYLTSDKVGSFEDITLLSGAPDRDYYIMVAYRGNNFNDAPAEVKGSFKLSGFGHDDTKSNVYTFTFDEPGYYYYFGPFRKVGKTFTLQP
jgi:hypothetical protein